MSKENIRVKIINSPVFEPIQNNVCGFKQTIFIDGLPEIPPDIILQDRIVGAILESVENVLQREGLI